MQYGYPSLNVLNTTLRLKTNFTNSMIVTDNWYSYYWTTGFLNVQAIFSNQHGSHDVALCECELFFILEIAT